SDNWGVSEACRHGKKTQDELCVGESSLCRSDGHCGVMGTASTMACMVEALGLTLPGNAAIPAPDTARKVLAHMSGMEIVKMVENDLKLSDILTRKAFENAIMVNAAIGGSTNFVIHLLAIAGRMGIQLNLEDFDRFSSKIPLLANLQPSGKYFMEDFFYAGGLPPVIRQLKDHLHNDAITVTGQSIGQNNERFENFNEKVIAAIDSPFNPISGIVVLKGNLCETGAIIKPSAASPALMKHTGKAVVFEDIDDYKNKIDDPDLDIDENSVMILKNVGPKGYPGMPEVGNMGLPPKVLEKGIDDMIRISDGRMSGTGFGTVVLHATPEAAEGGNFAVVQTGDMISLDVEGRKLDLLVSDEELAKRKAAWKKPPLPTERGYVSLYVKHVEQANLGADLDFLKGNSGSEVTKDSH
ncbi:dihydroxy-acid dehydratase, partial [Cyclobacterium sp.]|uniref:dihydroxy-acid dehydratase n=1 Tax=Cyclobacterium sp. TaxID=1966343 RepID=UPI00198721C0